MTLRNFPAPSQKTLVGGGCVRILRPRLPIAQSGVAPAPFSFTRRHPFLVRDFIHPKKKKKVNGKHERAKKQKTKSSWESCPERTKREYLEFRNPSSAAERLYLPRRSSVFLAPTNVTIHVAGRTDGCVNSRHLSCSGSNLRTLSLEPPTPVAR